MRRIFYQVFVAVVLIISLTMPARGQTTDPDSLNITTSPLPISLSTKPGQVITTELRIKNGGNKPEALKVGLMKFTAFGDEGKPFLQDRQTGDDYFDWVSFSQTEFSAEPNVWKTIKMSINVPKDAAFGYYYAVTFSRANPNVPGADKATTIKGGTATLVLLEVESPNAHRELKLTNFEVSKRSYEFLPAKFTIKLTNTGNIHVSPFGTIYIYHGGKQIDTIPVNDTRGNILPSSGRVFSTDWKNGFPVYEPKEINGATLVNNGQTQYQLSWKLNQLKNLRFGKYTAHLTVVYDDGKRDIPMDASVEFWVIPWRLIAIFIGIPLLIIIVITYLLISRWRYKNKATKFKR